MRVNSKDCKRGQCRHFPCDKKKCDNQLAFRDDKTWFIAEKQLSKKLNGYMKKYLYWEDRNTKVIY